LPLSTDEEKIVAKNVELFNKLRDEARKVANRSQFMSNHIYDHKSYEDGFFEGMNQALRQFSVVGRSEQLATHQCKFYVNVDWTKLKCECGKEQLPSG
jgi:hypothetical protein